MVSLVRAAGRAWAVVALLAAMRAEAGPLTGRVFDAVEGAVFADAGVRIAGQRDMVRSDRNGFFRIADVPGGAHWLEVQLPDGRSLRARILVRPGQAMSYAELDLARIVAPDVDDAY